MEGRRDEGVNRAWINGKKLNMERKRFLKQILVKNDSIRNDSPTHHYENEDNRI